MRVVSSSHSRHIICSYVDARPHLTIIARPTFLGRLIVFLFIAIIPGFLLCLLHYNEAEAAYLYLKTKILMMRIAVRTTVPDLWEANLPKRRDRSFNEFEGEVYTYERVEQKANEVNILQHNTHLFLMHAIHSIFETF